MELRAGYITQHNVRKPKWLQKFLLTTMPQNSFFMRLRQPRLTIPYLKNSHLVSRSFQIGDIVWYVDLICWQRMSSTKGDSWFFCHRWASLYGASHGSQCATATNLGNLCSRVSVPYFILNTTLQHPLREQDNRSLYRNILRVGGVCRHWELQRGMRHSEGRSPPQSGKLAHIQSTWGDD